MLKMYFNQCLFPLGTELQGNESNPRYYSDPGPGQCPVDLQTKVPKDYAKFYIHGELELGLLLGPSPG